MAKKKELNKEAHVKSLMDSELKNIQERKRYGILPLNPTRHFAINEKVQWGALKETYIREIFEDGLYYIIESIAVVRDRSNPPENEKRYAEWHEIFKYNANQPTTFRQEEKYFLRLSNAQIGSLLNRVYHAGVDFDVDYQRDHVWKLDDKIALIDSIFNNIDIGKFVFVQRDFGFDGKLYEVIDGKQRLTAICEFFEDRFKYNGFYYSELSNADKNKFENHGITFGYLENPDKRSIFETFIKLNTCGKPMAKKHIDKVRKLLNELK
jgi:hypothetical protein